MLWYKQEGVLAGAPFVDAIYEQLQCEYE